MLLNITTVSVMNLRFVGGLGWAAAASDNGSILGLGLLCARYVFGPENGALPIGSGRFAGWRNTASFIGAGGVRKQIMCLPRNGVTKQFLSFRGNYVTIPWMTSPADDGPHKDLHI